MDRIRSSWTFLAAFSLAFLLVYFLFVFHSAFGKYGGTRYLLLTVFILFFTATFVFGSLLRRGTVGETRLKQFTLLSFSILLSLLFIDTAYVIYNRLTVGPTDIWSIDRAGDGHVWAGELSPPVFFPTDKNFEIHKPNQIAAGHIYGWLYYPQLLTSKTISRSVLEKRRVTYSIDEHGFRDSTRMEEARVLALGDSFTVGSTIDQRQCWVDLLEKNLGMPIYNLGVEKSSPKQQQLLLEHLLGTKEKSLKPDRLLWMIFEGNDLEDSYLDLRIKRLRDSFKGTLLYNVAELPDLMAEGSVAKRILSGNIVFSFATGQTHNPYEIDGVKLAFPLYHSDTYGYRLFEPNYLQRATKPASYVDAHPNRPLLDEAVRNMVRLSKRYGFTITVLIAPSAERLYANYFKLPNVTSEPHFINHVAELSESLNLQVVNLYALMQPYAAKELLYFRDDTHWNERGNQVVADILSQNVDFGR